MNLFIKGLGTDIIEIRRIREAIDRHGQKLLERLFTEQERAYCLKYRDAGPRFAGRFAAKEAIVKALGKGFTAHITWQDITIFNDQEGQPQVQFSKRLQKDYGDLQVFLSISHCQNYATATALIVRTTLT